MQGGNCVPEEDPHSNYSKYYKNSGKALETSVQQRREVFLNRYKEKHDAFLDENRDLSQLFEEEIVSENESMDVDKDQEKSRKKRRVKFKMTMSEWFLEIPQDLSEKWLFKLCPQGRRRLIIANGRTTKAFDKFGHFAFQFQSNLPGGGKSKHFSTEKSGMTVLDCIFNEKLNTFYILDMLVWNLTSFLDCEAELRHSWIWTKFIENPEFFQAYGLNSYNFTTLHCHPAEKEIIQNEMFQYKFQCEIPCDGLIFYHKEAPYVRGNTQLVTWLKPFMLPNLFHIQVPEEYLKREFECFTDLESYLKRKPKRQDKKRNHKKAEETDTEGFEMDAAEG